MRVKKFNEKFDDDMMDFFPGDKIYEFDEAFQEFIYGEKAISYSDGIIKFSNGYSICSVVGRNEHWIENKKGKKISNEK